MPVFYNFTQDGLVYSFDDIFVPADLFREGGLWIWGYNTLDGQLGTNDGISKSTPVTTFAGGSNWKQVSCSMPNNFITALTSYHTSAIKTDGTLWSWGAGGQGQLGINDTTSRITPVTTFAGGTDWKQVSNGRSHTASIKTDGTLWTWGDNDVGQLGINSIPSTFRTPVTTFAGGTNWKQVSCGTQHTAAIKTDGTLWVWGRNDNGQIGDGTTINRSTPVTTFAGGNNWRQVSCGSNHTLSIKTDGTLWVWGDNTNRQLGDNSNLDRSTPVTTFAGGTNWKQVSGGTFHTAAIKTDGTLWVWGSDSNGRLGTNGGGNVSTPVTTFAGGTNWKQVDCTNHTAAIKTDGTLWVWGYDNGGTLGTNDGISKSTPVTTFAGGNDWKQASCGNLMTSAITYEDPVI